MNIYGVRGYPTPDFTDERHCRTFSIPNTTIALGVFMGALWTLADEKNWQQYGDMTPAEAADLFQDVLWEAYANDEGICPVIEAPYWDTYDNADDQEPEGDPEAWYGELVPVASLLPGDELTWQENIGIWAIAGFIAYAGQIGAAIAFVPFARRFVLKFRGNPLGAIAEVFVDGAKIATLDTASSEDLIKAIDIQLPDDEEEHEIWVAVGEDSAPGTSLQVVRKELNPSEVYPENLRYDSDCDCIQQTYDGGETWVDQPGQDPRHSSTFLYPPVDADDPRCQAAANMSSYFEHLIGTALGVMSAGLDALGVATAIMPVFVELGPFAILIDIGFGLGAALIGLGVDVINSEFTPEVYDALTCIFYCNIELDGQVTPDDLSEINAQIGADLNPDVYLIMAACFLLMGEVGLSNAGTMGEAPADCDACDCSFCYTWDFNLSDYAGDGWAIESPYGHYATGGPYQSSTGYGLILALTFPSTATVVRVVWDGTSFGGGGPYGRAVLYTLSGVTVYNSNESGIGNPYSQDVVHTDLVDKLRFNPYSGSDADVYIIHVTVYTEEEIPEWSARLCP